MGVGSAVKHAAERVAGDIDLPEFPPKELENLRMRPAKADASGRAEGEGKDKAQEVGDRMSEQVRCEVQAGQGCDVAREAGRWPIDAGDSCLTARRLGEKERGAMSPGCSWV